MTDLGSKISNDRSSYERIGADAFTSMILSVLLPFALLPLMDLNLLTIGEGNRFFYLND